MSWGDWNKVFGGEVLDLGVGHTALGSFKVPSATNGCLTRASGRNVASKQGVEVTFWARQDAASPSYGINVGLSSASRTVPTDYKCAPNSTSWVQFKVKIWWDSVALVWMIAAYRNTGTELSPVWSLLSQANTTLSDSATCVELYPDYTGLVQWVDDVTLAYL